MLLLFGSTVLFYLVGKFNMLRAFLFFVFLAFSLATNPSFAQTQSYTSAREIPMEVFAQLPKLEDVSISPNGRYLAIVYPVQGEAKFVIFDLAKENAGSPQIIDTGKAEVNWIKWLSNDRLLLNYGFYAHLNKKDRVFQTRLMAFNRDGSGAIQLITPEQLGRFAGSSYNLRGLSFYLEMDRILSYLPDDPDHILIQLNFIWGPDAGVYKINVNNGQMEQITEPENTTFYWEADHKGKLRLGYGFRNRHYFVQTRVGNSSKWKVFEDHDLFRDSDLEPIAFGFDDKTMIVRSNHETDTYALYKFDLETATLGEKIYENPDYDTDDLITSEANGEILAATYTEDYQEYYFFNEDYKKMLEGIKAALPAMRIAIQDSSPDFRFHVVRSYSSFDPGALYLYDDETKDLSIIWEVMPGLDPALMSEVKSVTYLARDGLEIPGYLTVPKESDGKNLPTIILVHGGPWARDDMVFNAEVQFLASRGYAVLQPNFRGSSGFGKEFEEKGYVRWAGTMQHDLLDAIEWLAAEGITDKQRVCIVGGSYGGYAALMSAAKFSESYQCAFAFAPVTDMYHRMQRMRNNRAEAAYDFWKKAVTGRLTANSYNKIAPIKYVKDIEIPVFLIHGDEDGNVDIEHSKRMAKALKRAKKDYQYVILEGAGHGVVEEKHRVIYFRHLENFLAKHLGGGQ